MGILSWRGLVIPKFSAPPSGETMCQTPKVFKVQERARDSLSPCQVWLHAKFHPHRCNVSPLRDEKPNNQPLSKLNHRQFALHAMLSVNNSRNKWHVAKKLKFTCVDNWLLNSIVNHQQVRVHLMLQYRVRREVVQKDCQACNLNRQDATDRGRWKKLIKTGWWSGWWLGECFFW